VCVTDGNWHRKRLALKVRFPQPLKKKRVSDHLKSFHALQSALLVLTCDATSMTEQKAEYIVASLHLRASGKN